MEIKVAGADAYRAGACNIGPDEIRRRERSGHVGTVTTVGLAAALIAARAPGWLRMLTAVPATVGAAGYIQARLRFCAGYGHLGVFNFGPAGQYQAVTDADAAAADRRRARQISLASGAIGLLVAALVATLPVRERG
ncbi:MAG: hypothetical protein M3Y29_05775 [Chloroflexota bacterium]|nr:hypothetical protein [Chloroflexota bacterium]